MKKILILIIGVVVLGGGAWYVSERGNQVPQPLDGETPGETAVPAVATYHNADSDRIIVTAPAPGAVVSNIFTVSGEARGGWYFEASFPLEVRGANDANIVQMPVQAQGEWMTNEFVPFSVEVAVPASYKGPATLILRNDNASGLPENDASISIPITIQ